MSYRPRSQAADLYRNRPNTKQKRRGSSLPVLFRGSLGPGKKGNDEQRLDAVARRRVREATIESGELRGWVQLQVEWLREWVRNDRLEPKEALAAMRGLQKSLQDCYDRQEVAGANVSMTLEVTPEAVEALQARGVNVTDGDDLVVH